MIKKLRALSCAALGMLALALLIPAPSARAQSTSISSAQQALQAQLNELNAEITTLQGNLASAQQQENTLQGELNVLDDQIKESQLAIQARNLTIEQLSESIQQTEDSIAGLNDQLQGEYASLAAIMREQDELETTSPVIAALTSTSLSEFFADVDQFSEINQSMQQSFTQIQTNTQSDEAQESDLQTQLNQETQLEQVQQLQQQQLQSQEDQKNELLSETKGQEASYQSLISSKQQTAAQIRAALFALTGTQAIPFGQALQDADLAEQKTGIRPAFLLGLITEESDLGENVGTGSFDVDSYQCYIDLGSPKEAATQKTAFDAIVQSLGLSPDSVPVSKKQDYGCGGAMGPAQFIATTWALYAGYTAPSYSYDPSQDRIGALTGDKPPSPWNAEDAFMAAALYLTDDGAAAQTPAAEFRAAMCYLAGCADAGNVSLQFYGDQVQCLELKYQEDIDTINGTNDAAAMKANTLYYGQC